MTSFVVCKEMFSGTRKQLSRGVKYFENCVRDLVIFFVIIFVIFEKNVSSIMYMSGTDTLESSDFPRFG